MRYLILALAILTVLFMVDKLSEPLFQELKNRREIVRLINSNPKIVWCLNCDYTEYEGMFKNGCPRCGKKLEVI